MTDLSKTTKKVASTQSLQVSSRRSRIIVTVIMIFLLIGGAVIITGRIMPQVNGGLNTIINSDKESSLESLANSIEGTTMIAEPMMYRDEMSVRSTSVSKQGIEVSDDIVTDVAEMDTRVMRNGSLDMVVANMTATMERVSAITAQYSGVIARSQFWTVDEQARGSIAVRVPVAQFDAAFVALKDVAVEVTGENTSVHDVTEEFVDLEAQLVNKKRQETRLQELFDRATKVEDLLKIERELSRVRGDIERFEGRKRYMASQTDYATITMSIQEDEKVITIADRQWRPAAVASAALNRLGGDIENFLSGVIMFLGYFIPLFALYSIALWIVWIISKKLLRKFQKPKVK